MTGYITCNIMHNMTPFDHSIRAVRMQENGVHLIHLINLINTTAIPAQGIIHSMIPFDHLTSVCRMEENGVPLMDLNPTYSNRI